ncbi:MAG: ABC transporter substrate-binding protein [Puniceicoccales bacterium]|nr:ABC transporter substrate-binding protein [Puniceicoccales bacterium]
MSRSAMFTILRRILLVCGLGCAQSLRGDQPKNIPVVAITTFAEHRAVDSVRRGIEDVLFEFGYEEKKTVSIRYLCAQGSSATAAQIAKMIALERPKVIVPISTTSAQSVAAATRTVPIVFASVTDPVGARVIKNWDASGTNVTGVSDLVFMEEQIRFMRKLLPNMKSVGFIYNPGETNSVAALRELTLLLARENVSVLTAPVQVSADIPLAVRSLRDRVDLVFTPTDNTIGSAYESLARAADECKVPAVTADPELVRRGASASLGVSYYDLGRQAGMMVVKVLSGTSPGDIAPEVSGKAKLFLNRKAARLQGLQLPEDLVKSADYVFGK